LVTGSSGNVMLESQRLGASVGAIARSGLGKAIAFKNSQASKLPIHSRELARYDRPFRSEMRSPVRVVKGVNYP
jgi:hypothetical protein